MNKILRKRLPRDFRENFGRYLALTLLITLGIYLVLSIVGSSETIITGTEKQRKVNKVEDGEFTVFLPLTKEEITSISKGGTVIEPIFYTDITLSDKSKLRMFKNRKKIDLVQLDDGRLAKKNGEVVLEKRYAQEHNIQVKDKITVGKVKLTVVGVGSVPDYDKPIANLADSAVESSTFGLMFVTDEQYEDILEQLALNAEQYTYAYRLGKKVTNNKLKEKIEDIDFDYTKVDNKYFKETIEDALKQREEIEDGVKELKDGAKSLKDGITELDSNSEELKTTSENLFRYYLRQINKQISESVPDVTLTKDNYNKVLTSLAENDSTGQIAQLKESVNELKAFCDGIGAYTDGVSESADGSEKLYSGTKELSDKTKKILDESFQIKVDNLTEFITADKNTRIESAAEDVVTNKSAGLLAGIIILILFTYVISVFVVHQIERESSVIGAFYALGVKKRQLLLHYITLPTIVAFVGGVIGTIIAYTPIGAKNQMADTYAYFSLPQFNVVFPVYLIVYGVVLPPVIAAIVNALVINKKLSCTALSLIKNEQKAASYRDVKIKTNNFVKRFKIRQLIRESRSGMTVVFGMLISLMLLMLGLDCYIMCSSVKVNNVKDTKYEYMYLYKYPEKNVPDGGEEAYVKSLSIDCMGNKLDATIIGVVKNSKYFDVQPKKGISKVVVNNSIAERYGTKKGDNITLFDSVNDVNYTFTVTGEVQYAPGFTIFMDIGSMRELFGEEDTYFNAVYADKKLNIKAGRLYSVTSKEDVKKSSAVFINIMMALIVILIAAGIVIFCVVMYLMMGVMIDRSSYGISLIKIFGYRPKEIRKLYLDGNFMIIAIGGLICIPLSKILMDAIWPYFVTNLACSMKLSFPWYLYIVIYLGLLLTYFIINHFMIRKIKKITPAEVLKNRE